MFQCVKISGGGLSWAPPFSIVEHESSAALCSFAFPAVQSSFFASPSFPPADSLLSFLRSVSWEDLAHRFGEALLFSFALAHTLSLRLWQNRGRLSPLLRSLASWLSALASALPEPLSASAPRSLLVSALLSHGEPEASLKKASRASLLRLCQKRGLL